MDDQIEMEIKEQSLRIAREIIELDTEHHGSGYTYFNSGRLQGIVEGFRKGIESLNLFSKPFGKIIQSKFKVGDKVQAYGSDGVIALNVYDCQIILIAAIFEDNYSDGKLKYRVKCLGNGATFIVDEYSMNANNK